MSEADEPCTITREEVKNLIKECRGHRVEGIIPYKAFFVPVQQCVSNWEQPALTCLGNVADDFREYLNEEVKDIFGVYPPLAKTIS